MVQGLQFPHLPSPFCRLSLRLCSSCSSRGRCLHGEGQGRGLATWAGSQIVMHHSAGTWNQQPDLIICSRANQPDPAFTGFFARVRRHSRCNAGTCMVVNQPMKNDQVQISSFNFVISNIIIKDHLYCRTQKI